MSNNKKYSKYVFINCPFDKEYNPIFEAIVFTIYDCRFLPRCAKEEGEEVQLTMKRLYKCCKVLKEEN